MPFRKHPTYVRKARNGYQLQRGVPKDVQPVIGKTIWVEAAGSTYRVAQRLSPAFAAKTDRLIAEARNEVLLTGEELIDSRPQLFDLKNLEIVDLLLEGSDVAVEEGLITLEQEAITADARAARCINNWWRLILAGNAKFISAFIDVSFVFDPLIIDV